MATQLTADPKSTTTTPEPRKTGAESLKDKVKARARKRVAKK